MKTEVYSWRLSAERKRALEREARHRRVSVSALLDDITGEWLAQRNSRAVADDLDQARRHKEAEKFFGIFAGKDPHRAERAGELVRDILERKYGRRRSR